MKRALSIAAVCALFAFLALAAKAPDLLHFPLYGYSIAPLEAPITADRTLLSILYLPATDGFGPNVNIIVQRSKVSLDDELAATKKELDRLGLHVISMKKAGDDMATSEYSGRLSQKDLHCYSRIVIKGNQAFIVTATSTEKQWPDVSDKLKACVDSFKPD